MNNNQRWILIACLGCLLLDHRSARGSDDQVITNLRAFAKLYGYVKYFHPSDEAASVDWKRFAIHGAAKVKEAQDPAELRSRLTELFGPLAPTLQIYTAGESAREVLELFPKDSTGFEVVAWQHRGDGLDAGTTDSPYQSYRMHQPKGSGSPPTGQLMRSVPADPCKAKQLRLRARVRLEKVDPSDSGALMVRTYVQTQMQPTETVTSTLFDQKEWTPVELVTKLSEGASDVEFGCELRGEGRVWMDDVEVSCQDESGTWKPLEIDNADFEHGTPDAPLGGWYASGAGYEVKLDPEAPASGQFSGQLVHSGRLFEQGPSIGESIDKELAPGLRCRIPVALYTDGKTTLPVGNREALDALQAELGKVLLDELKADNEALRLGDVIIAWNVPQHFYPYFDVVDTDWDAALLEALRAAIADRTEKDFFWTLRRMIARLQDGHGGVFHPLVKQWAFLPLIVDLVEGQIVVTATAEPEPFHVGDIVLEIDGTPAPQILHDGEELRSGSPQWKRYRVLSALTVGDMGTVGKVKLQRGTDVMEVESKRMQTPFGGVASEFKHQDIEKLEEGIYYVNLETAEMSTIDARIDELANARGVVFDLRGYPNGNHDIIRHMIDQPVQSARWNVPLILYPDHERVVGYDTNGRWTLEPKAPRLKGKVVFMTDGRAISYAESFMGIIEAYKLADIVGQTTAGTNGNVNPIELPGGYRFTWTGMKVLKHDGSRHHLVGILPTVPVERTLQGVREGKDEFLEKALELIRG